MKTRFVLMLMFLSAAAAGQCAQDKPREAPRAACWKTAETQYELNLCAGSELKQADRDLNDVYGSLLARLKNNSRAATALKSAQQAWLAFRDAYMDSYYPLDPDRPAFLEYGSSFPMCKAITLTELTRQRTRQLRAMLDPPEDDVCSYRHAWLTGGASKR